jgi:hypothetical protein
VSLYVYAHICMYREERQFLSFSGDTVCMYVCMYVCTCVHVCVCECIEMICVLVCICTYVYV